MPSSPRVHLQRSMRHEERIMRSNIWRLAAVFAGILLPLWAGCSDVTPYYRAGYVVPLKNEPIDQQVATRVILVGDAGDTKPDTAVLDVLQEWASQIPEKTTLIFLGDNVYPEGMPEPGNLKRQHAERRLVTQLAVVRDTGVKGLFLSGNHDWGNDRKGGLGAVRRQAEYVNNALGSGGHFLPANGSPGPVKTDLECVRLIVLNTAWWLHEEGAAASPDPREAEESMLRRLADLLETADESHVLVVAHHPLISYGNQGGFYDWKDHVFPSLQLHRWLWIPTPGLGSLYPLLRNRVFNKQTLNGTAYKRMRIRLTETLSARRPILYVAGHDHGLQVIEGGAAAEYMLVSALGLDVGGSLTHGRDTLFSHKHSGFMVVDFTWDGAVLLRVVEPRSPEVVFLKWLRGCRRPNLSY